ncbi:HicB family protein [bacterium]|nr:HicB family protein [bacterium]
MKKKKETIYKYEAIFDPNGGGYTVTIPKLPGLVTEGDNLKEAREMAKDAIRCYLEGVLKAKAFHSPQTRTVKKRISVAVSI